MKYRVESMLYFDTMVEGKSVSASINEIRTNDKLYNELNEVLAKHGASIVELDVFAIGPP